MISDDGKLAQTFNEYFVNIVPSLGIAPFHENNDDVNNDNIDNSITKFEDHPSVVPIKEQMKKNAIKLSLSRILVQTARYHLLKK